MVDLTSNDNDFAAPGPRRPDGHGEAAMLLVESLIHDLIDRQVIGVGDAVQIVGVAKEIATELNEAPAVAKSSLGVLSVLHASLAHDLPGQHGQSA